MGDDEHAAVVTRFDQAAAKLDFDKIRQRILRYVSSDPVRELVRNLTVSSSLDDIRRDLATVSEMKRLLEGEGDIPIGEVFPIKTYVQRASIEGAVLPPRELLHICSILRDTQEIRAFLAKRASVFPLLWGIASPLAPDKVLEFNITHAIDASEAVRADASKELQSIRRSIDDKSDVLRRTLERILKTISEQGFSQEEIITTREGRMVIPVKTEHKNRLPGFIHSTSASGATVFVEPTETLELNNEITSLHFSERREVERILADLTTQVRTLSAKLLQNVRLLALFEFLRAKAKYSMEILGSEPFVSAGPIRLRQARHPVLLATHGVAKTLPLDMELGDTFHTLVISGPNAGGKTVAMKCVGLLTLMVQAGLHVPVSPESSFRAFKDIFVDIGDDQSIENDLSTFSSHLSHLKEIVASATGESLVLIDEIGSGTDPAEGGAIAASVLELLTLRSCFTIATTHHGFLKVFAHETDGVENGAMEFDQTTLTPTYRFRTGVPGSSFALEMASRLEIGEEVLNRARRLLGEAPTRLESLIGELEGTTQRYRAELEILLTQKKDLDLRLKEYESKLAGFQKESQRMRREAVDEARELLDRANATIERTVREIRSTAADPTIVKQLRGDVATLRREIEASEQIFAEPDTDDQEPIVVGRAVRLRSGSETGEVESIAADRKTAFVVFGGVRMKVPLKNLVVSQSKQRVSSRPAVQSVERPDIQLQDIDLRGMTGDEALPLVDKLIDTAVIAGLHRIDIIHGKGTGALRKRVADFLSRDPRVLSFHLGEWNEGGTGATVVELKD